MKEIFISLRDKAKADPKEFYSGAAFIILVFTFAWGVIWLDAIMN